MIKKISGGIFNQVLSAGAVFILNVYFAFSSSSVDYANFFILMMSALLCSSLSSSVVTTPLIVNSVTIDADAIAKSYRALLVFTGLFFFVIATYFLITIGERKIEFYLVQFVFSIAIATRDFFSRVSFKIDARSKSLLPNLINFLGVSIFVGFSYFFDKQPYWYFVVFLYAILVIISFGIFNHIFAEGAIGSGIRTINFAKYLIDSKWLILGVVVLWLQSQSFALLMPVYFQKDFIGSVAKIKIYMAPFSFLLPAISMVLLPMLVERRDKYDRKQQLDFAFKQSLLMGAAVIFYSSTILLLIKFVSFARVEHGSVDFEFYFIFWVACLFLQSIRDPYAQLLQAKLKFKGIAVVNAVCMSISSLFIFIFGYLHYPIGASLGIVLAEIVFFGMLFFYARRNE